LTDSTPDNPTSKSSKPNSGKKKVKQTIAPTNAATLEKFHDQLNALSSSLDDEQQDFVNLIEQHYSLHKKFPSKRDVQAYYSMPASMYDEFLESEAVIQALVERKLMKRPENVGNTFDPALSWRHRALKPEQLIAVNTLLDLVDTRSQKKKLQDLGISTREYNRWLQDPEFLNYLHERAEGLIKDGQHEAHMALMDKVRAGDMKAISYYNELTGRHIQAANKQNAQDSINFRQVLVSILEIINDEVDDPQVAMRISERLQSVASSNKLAGELTNSSKPQVPQVSQVKPLGEYYD